MRRAVAIEYRQAHGLYELRLGVAYVYVFDICMSC